MPPVLLTLDTQLLSVKKNNNTYGHYGEMASWQMRGIVVPKALCAFTFPFTEFKSGCGQRGTLHTF